MPTKIQELRSVIRQLKREISILRVDLAMAHEKYLKISKRNETLKNRIYTPKSLMGSKAELFVAKLVSGELTRGNDSCDIVTDSQIRIEVKFSRLRYSMPGKSTSKRWTWADPLGRYENKVYDFLILIGESDKRYQSEYCDNKSKYVIFEIPRSEIDDLIGNSKIIQCSSNPTSGWSSQKRLLFDNYHVSRKQLSEHYTDSPKTWKHDSK